MPTTELDPTFAGCKLEIQYVLVPMPQCIEYINRLGWLSKIIEVRDINAGI